MEEERAKDLSDMFDIEISSKQIILSHTPMKSLVEKYENSKVLIVGSRKSPEVAKHYGFKKSIGVEGIHLKKYFDLKNMLINIHICFQKKFMKKEFFLIQMKIHLKQF